MDGDTWMEKRPYETREFLNNQVGKLVLAIGDEFMWNSEWHFSDKFQYILNESRGFLILKQLFYNLLNSGDRKLIRNLMFENIVMD